MAVVGTVYGTEQVLARLRAMPDRVRQSLVDAMKVQWFSLQAKTVGKLSNDVLRRRTGVLASSINVGGQGSATEFLDTPGEIVGRVGTRVKYAAVHEYGGTFSVKAHDRTVGQVFGRPVNPFQQHVRAHDVVFPERSFLRSSLRDMSGQIRDSIAAAVRSAVEAT